MTLMNYNQMLVTAELLLNCDSPTTKEVSLVSGIPERTLNKNYALDGYAVSDVLLVVLCNEFLLRKSSENASGNTYDFGLGLKLLHKIIHYTNLSIAGIGSIRSEFSCHFTTVSDSFAIYDIEAELCRKAVVNSLQGKKVDDLSRAVAFLSCVREDTLVT